VAKLSVRGSVVIASYYQNSAGTGGIHGFGWQYVRSIGYLDAEGDPYIVDRVKDIIISGKFNVYGTEVELMAHPDARGRMVVG
jgi:long-chain acyl-CoA synthetase